MTYGDMMLNYLIIICEKEILLEPETKFIVDNVFLPINDIIHMICKILTSNLLLDSNETQ